MVVLEQARGTRALLTTKTDLKGDCSYSNPFCECILSKSIAIYCKKSSKFIQQSFLSLKNEAKLRLFLLLGHHFLLSNGLG